MFEQYLKLFDIEWIGPWLVEALFIMISAFVIMFVICKAMDCMSGEDR